jgi:hypothetical protein
MKEFEFEARDLDNQLVHDVYKAETLAKAKAELSIGGYRIITIKEVGTEEPVKDPEAYDEDGLIAAILVMNSISIVAGASLGTCKTEAGAVFALSHCLHKFENIADLVLECLPKSTRKKISDIRKKAQTATSLKHKLGNFGLQ